MPTDILVPKLSFNSESAQISAWLAADGSEVSEGQPLLTVESERASVEIEAPASGRLTMVVLTGESHDVGTLIGPTELIDRQEIIDVLHDYCRAMDRQDYELAVSCWHSGGTDTHGESYSGSATGFLEWVWPIHQAVTLTQHEITNIAVRIAGDVAETECYWTVRMLDTKLPAHRESLATGRYFDRFERIDGKWAIRHRTSIRERVWSHAQLSE